MALLKHLTFILLLCSFLFSMALAAHPSPNNPSLAIRLQAGGGGMMECWGSLLQLHSCTGEVILFFLNGETYLCPSCCRAIRVIENNCWPAMLGALGFTDEEGDVLRGYCNASDTNIPSPPPASPSSISVPDLVH